MIWVIVSALEMMVGLRSNSVLLQRREEVHPLAALDEEVKTKLSVGETHATEDRAIDSLPSVTIGQSRWTHPLTSKGQRRPKMRV